MHNAPQPWFGFALALASLLSVAANARAAEQSFEITVDAGKHDRSNAPITAQLAVKLELAKATAATLTDEAGKAIVGQITAPSLTAEVPDNGKESRPRQLHFILPELKAGKSAKFTVKMSDAVAPAASSSAFRFHETPGEYIDLAYGDRPVLRYMCKPLDDSTNATREQTYKVYHHVYDPAGKQIVTKGPGGQYTHHRGLYYGFNKVNYGPNNTSCDIWHCRGAHQEHAKVLASEAGPVLGRQLLEINWCGKDKEVFAKEHRELTAYNTPGGTLIEFASKLTPVIGPIKLDGDPQHAGFHFRASNEVNEKTKGQTYYLRPDGKDAPGKTRNWPGNKDHVDLPWNAMSFVVGGNRYSVAYLDSPKNPKEARFSERDYGRFGSYFATDVTTEKPLLVNYRVWLQDGELTGAEAAALDADFDEAPRATVKS